MLKLNSAMSSEVYSTLHLNPVGLAQLNERSLEIDALDHP